MEEESGICLLGQLSAQGCAGANEGLVEASILYLPRCPENTVAPAKAGAHHVCLGRPAGEIGPSLRWGDDRNYGDS